MVNLLNLTSFRSCSIILTMIHIVIARINLPFNDVPYIMITVTLMDNFDNMIEHILPKST